MNDFLKNAKMDVIVSAVLCIVFGVVLILWPDEIVNLACQTVGIILAVLGGVQIASYFVNKKSRNNLYMGLGLVLFLIGLWITMRPGSIQSLIFIIIGTAIFVHGIHDIKLAFECKRSGYTSWWTLLLLGLLSIVLGIVCIINCFGVISVAVTLVGIMLIYDGVSDLWIVSRLKRTVKDIKQEMEAVDTDYEEL